MRTNRWPRGAAGLFGAIAMAASASPALAQASAGAEQGVPGAPDQTAPHTGTTTLAAVDRQPPALDLSVLYIAELWRNGRGGIRTGGRYLDNLDVTLTVDGDRALGWRGATLFVYGLWNNGHAFSGDLVGDEQTVSNIETGVRAARLYQAWIEQRFDGDHASIKAGLYDLNSEFDTTNVGSLSLLSSHGIGPEFGQSGRNGPSIFPYTSLAVRGEYRFGQGWTARAAVLDGVPDDPRHPKRTVLKLGRNDGALAVAELDHVGTLANVTLGYWHYTSRFAGWTANGQDRGTRGNQGAYLVIERALTHVDPGRPDDKRGLAGFLQAGIADPRYNRVGRYLGGGLVYTGVAASSTDRLGFTFARAAFSSSYRRAQAEQAMRIAPAETVFELTYRRPITAVLTAQPDVQYIVHPSAAATLRNALVFGLRLEIGA